MYVIQYQLDERNSYLVFVPLVMLVNVANDEREPTLL